MKSSDIKRVVFFGTYDAWRPRLRLLQAGLAEILPAAKIIECHFPLWNGVEDKSQLKIFGILIRLCAMVVIHPVLIIRYLFLPRHEIVVIPYMGLFDVVALSLFARLRGVQLVWDIALSIYDTVVYDRKLMKASSPAAKVLYGLEWLATRLAHRIFLDTATHARYFEELYNLKPGSVGSVFVGAENIFLNDSLARPSIDRSTGRTNDRPFEILFYGQCIPLHGIETIVRAAELTERERKPFHWTIIGTGQEAAFIDALIKKLDLNSIGRIPSVPYHDLPSRLNRADICLGIFGTTAKATRVIPNKVFQILMAGKPLITADTPAIRELINRPCATTRLIPPGDAPALAHAVVQWYTMYPASASDDCARLCIGAKEVGSQLLEFFNLITESVACNTGCIQ